MREDVEFRVTPEVQWRAVSADQGAPTAAFGNNEHVCTALTITVHDLVALPAAQRLLRCSKSNVHHPWPPGP